MILIKVRSPVSDRGMFATQQCTKPAIDRRNLNVVRLAQTVSVPLAGSITIDTVRQASTRTAHVRARQNQLFVIHTPDLQGITATADKVVVFTDR
jgi:hypothetical protein